GRCSYRRGGCMSVVVEEVEVHAWGDPAAAKQVRRAADAPLAEPFVQPVERGLERACARCPRFELELAALPGRLQAVRRDSDQPERPRILELGQQAPRRLEQLARDVGRRAERALPREQPEVGPL